MSASTLTAYSPIPENSDATPGLFNSRFQTLQNNIVSVNSMVVLPINLSESTWASIGLGANSNNSDYIRLKDTSGQRSTYRIGSAAGGTADGLNFYDESGSTMIMSLSKQSIRFWQNVVGPVFDTGGALTSTLNAATLGTGADSKETRIQAAINQASQQGIARVYVPASMYPYTASSVSFIYGVQMVREGGDQSVYDVKAYGAMGDNIADDTASFQGALDSLQNVRGVLLVPPGNYKITSLTMSTTAYDGITVRGVSMRGSHLNFTTTGTAVTMGAQPGAVVSQIVWENLWITSSSSNIMFNMLNCSQCTFSRIYCDGSGNTGVNSKGWRLYACMATFFSEVSYGGNVNAKYGIYIGDDSDGTTIRHCYIKGEPTASSYSIVCDAGPSVAAHVCTTISDSIIGGGSVSSVLVGLSADTSLVQIKNNYFEGSNVCIELGLASAPYYARNILIQGNYFYVPIDHGIKLNATRRVRIEDNYFYLGGGFDIFFHVTATLNTGIIAVNNTPQDATFAISIPVNHQGSYYEDGTGYVHDRMGYLVNSNFWNPASIANGASLTKTTTVTGAVLGDKAETTISVDLQGLTMTSYVSAADTVTTVLANATGGAVDLALFDMYVKVSKY